jgi:hypothetical protein
MTIYVPPTGSQSLDLVLEQLASNVGNITASTANIVTYEGNGAISAGGTIIGYRDRYMYVLFADDVYGSNMSPSPVGRSYYAIVNTNNVVAPTNPLSYSYTQVSGGFGTTKNLYYKTTGGRNIQWYVGTIAPNSEWLIQPNTTAYNLIDLDVITGVSGADGSNGYSVFNASVFQTSNTVPVAPSGGTYTFSTSTLTAPAGWSTNVPNANVNVYQTSYLFSSNSTDTVTAGTWSSPSAVFRIGSNGAAGANGTTTTVGVVYQANTLTPLAISSQGFYDFANTRLIAPSGWSNVIPNNPSNTTIWSSQASFSTSNALANIANTTSWTTPALTFQSGGVGPAGTRGFVPLAYVITSGDPTLYSQAQFTNDFSASRTSTIPPIGTGYAPIAGDTAQFAGLGKSVVKSYNGTQWVDAVGTVIDGSLIVTGTITAAQLNTNSIYALTVRGGGVNGPNDTSNVGYWLDAGTGSSLFTGNTIIGNNLTVGNNTRIGGNLNVTGLITSGSLNSNTVSTTTVNLAAITDIQYYKTKNYTVIRNNPVNFIPYTAPNITHTLSTVAGSYIDSRFSVAFLLMFSGSTTQQFTCDVTFVAKSSLGALYDVVVDTFTFPLSVDPLYGNMTYEYVYSLPGTATVLTPGTYTYVFQLNTNYVPPGTTVTQLAYNSGTLITQQVKR